MRRLTGACALIAASAAPSLAQVQPPVGVATGEFLYEPLSGPGVAEDGDGEKLYIGPWSAPGTYTLSTGETLTLRPGSNPAGGRDTRPSIINGGGAVIDGTASSGTGTISLSNASTIELLGDRGSPSVFIGEDGGRGTFTLEGGSLLRLFDDTVLARDPDNGERGVTVTLGDEGTGTMRLDASTVDLDSSLASRLRVGSRDFGQGTLALANGSTLSLTQSDIPGGGSGDTFLLVGDENGTGAMTVSGSEVTMTSDSSPLLFRIGTFEGANGTLAVDQGSSITIDGADAEFFVGREATGVATFDGASTMTAVSRDPGADSLLFLGFGGAGSSGRLDVLGGSTITVGDAASEGAVHVGDRSPDAGDTTTGFLTVSGAGSSVASTRNVSVGKFGGEGASTGVLTVSAGGTLTSPIVEIGEGGTLNGAGGTIVGDVSLFDGGLLSPGTSPGALTIDGDLRLAGGALQIEIGGTEPGQSDVLSILGDLVVEGAFDLDVLFTDGFVPEAGESFAFLDVAGATGDLASFAQVSFAGAPGITASLGGSGGTFAVTAQVAPIPLPATGWLLGIALAGLTATSRPRRSA